jgi:hypothetical protein
VLDNYVYVLKELQTPMEGSVVTAILLARWTISEIKLNASQLYFFAFQGLNEL